MSAPRILMAVVGLLLIVSGAVAPLPARADCEQSVAGQYVNEVTGMVMISAECTRRSNPQPKPRAESGVCMSPAGDVISCRTADGTWNGEHSCYVRQDSSGETVADAADGDHAGVVMRCTTLGGSRFLYLVPAAAPPDPRVLAGTAVSRMRLSAIEIGSFPWTTQRSRASMGVVGWNVWLWVAQPGASTFGPVSKSVSVDGYTVTATAEVVEVTWDMGNGDVVSCGKGTPYPTGSSVRDPRSPDCGYVYSRDGDYRIRATTHWQVRWSGIGESGVIPMELTSVGDLTIAEIQVVNVPVGGN